MISPVHEAELQHEVYIPLNEEGTLSRAPETTDPTKHFRVLANDAINLSRLHENYWLARTDELTGVGNVLAYKEDLTTVMDEARKSGETVAILYLDVDGLKRVNEASTDGHGQGDLLLKSITSDTRHEPSRKQDLMYRLGGDEFVKIIRDVQPAAHDKDVDVTAKRIAKRQEDSANAHISENDLWFDNHAGLSVGVAVARPEDTVHTLTHRAEQDMVANKEARKKWLEERGIVFEDSRLLADDKKEDLTFESEVGHPFAN